MAAGGNFDQEIRIKYTLDTSSVLKDLGEVEKQSIKFQTLIASIQETMMRVMEATSASVKAIAKTMRDEFKKTTEAATAAKKAALQASPQFKMLTGDEQSKGIAAIDREAAEAIRNYNLALNAAIPAMNKYRSTQQKMREDQVKTNNAVATSAESFKKAETGTVRLVNGFIKLGATAKAVFGAIFGVGVISVIRDVIQGLDQMTEKAISYSQAQVGLASALREMVRRGTEVNVDDVISELTRLEEKFNIFSTSEITRGFAGATLRLARLGATVQDVGKVVETALILKMVDVEGRFNDVGEAAKVLATYLASGYGEGVERAGLIAGRAADAIIAFEENIGKTLVNLDPMERAMLRLNFVFEQVKTQAEDAGLFTESFAGQMQAAKAAAEDASVEAGMYFAPIKVAWEKAWAGIVKGFSIFMQYFVGGLKGLLYVFEIFVTNFIEGMWTIQSLMENPKAFDFSKAKQGFFDFGIEIGEALERGMQETATDFTADMEKYLEGALGGVSLGEPLIDADATQVRQTVKNLTDEIKDILEEYDDDVIEAQEELFDDMGSIADAELGGVVDTWDEYFSDRDNLSVEASQELLEQQEEELGDLGNIVEDGLSEALDIWNDYFQTLEDIARDEAQDILDAQIELQQDIQDVGIEYQQKLQDAARKYREAELKAERDYQEKLRRLREEFLFDLEDALRERDALQVLRLMRRYALDKEQLEREKDLEAEERAENYRNELEEIRIWRERRLQELRLEHQRRLEEIHIQAEREREEAEREREQKMAELEAELEAERLERLAAYDQELIDLDKRYSDRIAKIIEKMIEEKDITAAMAEDIRLALQAEFGAGGKVDGIYAHLVQTINTGVSAAIAAMAAMSAAAATYGGFPYTYDNSNGTASGGANLSPTGPINAPLSTYSNFALGGTMYANAPTSAMFGENGPEIAQFTPLSKLNTNDLSPVSNSSAQALQNGGGKIKLEVWLSDGLESRIIDNTMGQLASIFEGR